jgi:signal peptidase I
MSKALSEKVFKDIGFILLAEGKTIIVKAEGTSMYPSVKPGSVVFIEPFKDGTAPLTGEIIAWKRESGLVVHRLISSYIQKGRRYFVTRGDSSLAADDPVPYEQLAGRVVRIKTPGGKPVPARRYKNKKPNYRLNRYMVWIISQIYRMKRFL